MDEIFCLGDVIGYGPNPCECIDKVIENCELALLGNHDQGALFDPEGFNSGAERAIFWTRDQLENGVGTGRQIDRRWDFLGALPRTPRRWPVAVRAWLGPQSAERVCLSRRHLQPKENGKALQPGPKGCFQGHTHVPGVFTESRNFLTPEETNYTYEITNQKFMVNVGSVGQPRDGDPRPCYVIQEDDRITFHRIDYDVNVTANKIYSIPDLDNFLGDRIKQGR